MGEHGDDRRRSRHLLTPVAGPSDVNAFVEQRILRYCYEHAIPPSVFRGRVVAAGEPVWLPEDRAAVLRWQAEQDALCPGCRHPRAEAFDKANRYHVETHKCGACGELGRTSWQAQKNRGKNAAPLSGVYYTATKTET